MKQRLLTISVNTRYQVIFACLYWKTQGKVREFHVAWKVVTLGMALHSMHCSDMPLSNCSVTPIS